MEKAIDKARVLMEALPYIKDYYGKTVVVKFGGNAMENGDLKEKFASDVVLMRYVGMNPVIVHGGGPQVTEYMERMSLEVRFVDGHRVTDASTMDVAKMVLVGKVNKEIVSMINRHGTLAVGLSGEDGNLLIARKKGQATGKGQIDLGFVGEVAAVNTRILTNLMKEEFIPVVASIGADESGQSYNINADFVAGALASALRADKLIYLTDVDGIYRDMEDPSSLIPELNSREAVRLIGSGGLGSGMLPKVESCIEALRGGVRRAHIINGTVDHALLLELYTDAGVGTMVVA
ncbi:MAG: acetylglutamate kinase [Candidatus Solincola sediminis]|uniref:Acetylglutamate kinase n=1 Tax=Candidatus Solincola sediminis TaxID=1797199 RepID=A0A1F2WSK9_9ACTN|nr:MAG: acetylglutamate kinase [Candidatus Solincola sediminis]OFW60900.1 MAG: acetylglutamate kinase [Candidatus Solincola sediminis]